MPFPDLNLNLGRALSERGYAEPTPVQAAVLQPEAMGRDLLVSAQTGSGKTLAYGLAMAPTLLGNAERFEPAAEPLALIVAPTRELALQVHRELSWIYAYTGARVASCVGGMDIRREQRALAHGAHIVVGTPGRLRDHLERNNLDTSQLKAVVLDEADEMLDLGFREDLECILDASPAERRTLLFSATIPKAIVTLAKRYQRDAVRIATSAADEPHGDIEYRALRMAPQDAEHAVVNVLRYFDARGALVFCSTREAVRRLHGNLLERGFAVVALSGELSQPERSRALQALRDGRARVCVATDVAARGLDLPDLGLVIHADLPHDREILLHRSGRTGRAGRKGTCVLLVPYTQRRRTERLLASAHIEPVWSAPPSADEIRVRDQERLARDVLAEAPADEDLAAARALLADRAPEDIAAALVRLYRAGLPAPEELSEAAAGDGLAPGARRRPPPRIGTDDTVRFRINIGRNANADPRWLLPLICRRGHVTKNDVGRIRIMDRETEFEIARDAAARFASSARRPDSKDPEIRIEAVAADRPKPGGRKPRPGGPERGSGRTAAKRYA
jgi:ATP-dependent RNA helicase DeaD